MVIKKYIPSFRAVALFPSQRRTGEKPRTVQGSVEVVEQIETIFGRCTFYGTWIMPNKV